MTDTLEKLITDAVRAAVREELNTLRDQLTTPSNPHPDELLTTRQVAEELHIAENTLRRWRSDANPAGPPFIRMGNAIRYRRRDLNAWAK